MKSTFPVYAMLNLGANQAVFGLRRSRRELKDSSSFKFDRDPDNSALHILEISDKYKMSSESEERLKKLVEKCVNSAELEEASMKSVRSICRKDDGCIAIVVAELLWFLKRKHCVVR